MGHQPTQPEPICLLSSFPAREPAHVSRPSPYREAFRSLPLPSPGAADGRDPPVSFPLPLARALSWLASLRPVSRRGSRNRPLPFLLSPPAAAPLPLRHLAAALPCPRSATAAATARARSPFSPAPRPPAQPSPNPSRAMEPPRVPARTPKSPAAAGPKP
jgi:hypothetical protein